MDDFQIGKKDTTRGTVLQGPAQMDRAGLDGWLLPQAFQACRSAGLPTTPVVRPQPWSFAAPTDVHLCNINTQRGRTKETEMVSLFTNAFIAEHHFCSSERQHLPELSSHH